MPNSKLRKILWSEIKTINITDDNDDNIEILLQTERKSFWHRKSNKVRLFNISEILIEDLFKRLSLINLHQETLP